MFTKRKKAVGVLCFLFNVAYLSGAVSPGVKNEDVKIHFNTPIRVLIAKHATQLRIKSFGHALFVRPDKGQQWTQLPTEFTLQYPTRKGARPFESLKLPHTDSAIFVRGGSQGSDKVLFNTEVFRGAIQIRAMDDGYIVSNYLSLDDYLAGLLATEMSSSWEIEALKAQAVASRTYALYMMQHPKSVYYDLDKGTQDQVYGGAAYESERILKAVRETAGEFLSLYHGDPIKAYFHSRCGGTTETANVVWNERRGEHKIRVPCSYCRSSPYSWHASVSVSDLFSSLRFPLPAPTDFRMVPLQRTPSGRISSLLFDFNGKQKLVTGDQLREALGYARIKSTNLKWQIVGNEIRFNGVGAGHGVGMCQWGAHFLAGQKKSYREILAHYYPGAAIHR